VALVTGASSGVGRAISLKLAEEGASVILVGRRVDSLKAVAKECEQVGPKASFHQLDLENGEAIQQLAKDARQEFGKLDILVHSAGMFCLGKVAEAGLADFDRQYRCNVRAPFALTQLLLPDLIRNRGQIVFINSTAGLQAPAGISQYAATKHALKALADSLREEVNSLGIRVLSIYLGRTATPMQARVRELEGKAYDPAELIQPAQVAATVADSLAMGREAEIMDVRIRPMRKPAGAASVRPS
jgi:NADP-dependent 3-hydroxy acid dehydrogenase YdfG